VHLAGFFNSISQSKVELTQCTRLTDISMQKVKISHENGGMFFLPQKTYENTTVYRVTCGVSAHPHAGFQFQSGEKRKKLGYGKQKVKYIYKIYILTK
jgi:hypothetical protein